MLSVALATTTGFVPSASAQVVPRPKPETSSPAATTPAKKIPVAKAQTEATPVAQGQGGTIYLFRGLADFFSLGMNRLADEMRAKGIPAVATTYAKGNAIADQLAKDYKAGKPVAPIVLIGHSLGANEALTASARLGKQGVPVRLVVLFDATKKIRVPGNVQEVLNLYKPGVFGAAVEAGDGFTGTLNNQNVSSIKGIGHVSIDKSKVLHDQVVEKVQAVLAEKPAKKKK